MVKQNRVAFFNAGTLIEHVHEPKKRAGKENRNNKSN